MVFTTDTGRDSLGIWKMRSMGTLGSPKKSSIGTLGVPTGVCKQEPMPLFFFASKHSPYFPVLKEQAYVLCCRRQAGGG